MIEKSTTFTKSNFGVYKFQMTYQNLTKKQSQYIWRRLNVRHRKQYNSSAHKCKFVYTSENGVEIYLKTHKSRILSIDVVVHPRMILTGTVCTFAMFGEYNTDALMPNLEDKINKAVTRELGPEYTVDKAEMTEVECEVDIYLPKNVSTEYGITLIERSILFTEHEHLVKLYTYKNEKRIKETHGFRLNAANMEFTVHDWAFRPDYGYNFNLSMPLSALRLRIGLNRKVISDTIRDNRLCGIMAVLPYYADHSKEILNDFVGKHFFKGKYYPYQLVKCVINESGLPKKTKKCMYICADYFNLHTTADTKGFNKIMDELFEKKTKFEVLDTFEEIGVNPIPIDDHFDVAFPYMTMILA